MSRYAIAYDLCSNCFNNLDRGDSRRSAFYKSVQQTVTVSGGGYEQRIQGSVYSCPEGEENTFEQAQSIYEKIKQLPDYEEFVNSFLVFEMFNCTDLFQTCEPDPD